MTSSDHSIVELGTCDERSRPRRSVHLPAYGILANGETFGITIVDLTYEGCRIQTDKPITAGTSMRLICRGKSNPSAVVVKWCKSGFAGLRFDELSDKLERRPRQHDRVPISAHVSLRRKGRSQYRAEIFDLNEAGCRIEFIERPKPGEQVWIKFDGLDAIEAAVQWVTGFYGGLRFTRPIYTAVYELLLAKLKN